jgi:hypothetical protein
MGCGRARRQGEGTGGGSHEVARTNRDTSHTIKWKVTDFSLSLDSSLPTRSLNDRS